MLFTKFIYWFFKNFLALTLPLVVITWSFGMALPNATTHSQNLRNSGFYNELSSEIQKLSKENSFTPKEGLWYLIISSTKDEVATPTSLQELFEKNISKTTSWLDGQSGNWYFFLPTKTIHNSLEKNFDIKAVEVAQAKKDEIPNCPDQSLVKVIIDLQQDFCFPTDQSLGKGLYSDYIKSSLKYQGKIIQVLFAPDTQTLEKTDFKATEVGVINENVAIALNSFRDNFLKLKTTVNIMLPILLISLCLIPLLALALNKRPINESKIVLRLLGISTLVNTLVLIVTAQIIFLQNLNITGLRSEKIINIMSGAFMRFMFEVLSPSLYLAIGFIVLSIGLYLVERLDFDSLRQGVIKFEEKVLDKAKIRKPKKADN